MDYDRTYVGLIIAQWRAQWRARVLLLVFQIWGALIIGFGVSAGKWWWFFAHLLLSFLMSYMIGGVIPPRPRGGHAPEYRTIE
jgi:hypothetical protein